MDRLKFCVPLRAESPNYFSPMPTAWVEKRKKSILRPERANNFNPTATPWAVKAENAQYSRNGHWLKTNDYFSPMPTAWVDFNPTATPWVNWEIMNKK